MLILLLTIPCMLTAAREFVVEEMVESPLDLTASTHQRKDRNGNICALVKVQVPLEGVTFEGNVIGESQNHNGEYWVYVTGGTKMLMVKHSTLKPILITFEDNGIPRVEGKHTYVLSLVVPEENKKSVSDVANRIGGHEYVDLGLPSGILWAAANIGADSPSDLGEYFAWGEVAFKKEYNRENSLTFQQKVGKEIYGGPYDAARKIWGDPWRLPTKADLEELIKHCKWELTETGGCYGYKVTGPNGKSIFFPMGGFRAFEDQRPEFLGTQGRYWTATAFEEDQDTSYLLIMDTEGYGIDNYWRYLGHNIRPVAER